MGSVYTTCSNLVARELPELSATTRSLKQAGSASVKKEKVRELKRHMELEFSAEDSSNLRKCPRRRRSSEQALFAARTQNILLFAFLFSLARPADT